MTRWAGTTDASDWLWICCVRLARRDPAASLIGGDRLSYSLPSTASRDCYEYFILALRVCFRSEN